MGVMPSVVRSFAITTSVAYHYETKTHVSITLTRREILKS